MQISESGLRVFKENEQRLRDILEKQSELVVRSKPDGTLTFVNDAYCRYFGRKREELVGAKYWGFIPGEDHSLVQSKLELFNRQQPEGNIEHRVITPDGKKRWLQWSLRAIYHPNGEFLEFQAVGREVTERREAEESLREMQRLAQTTIDSLSGNICVLDETGTIILANRSWKDFALQNGGAEEKVSEGVNYLKICDEAQGEDSHTAKQFAAGIREVMKGEEDFFSLEYYCSSTDEEKWFLGKVTPYAEFSEGLRKVVISHVDISERKRAEKIFKQNMELKQKAEKLESLGVLAGGVSHDFNNYLATLAGNISVARQSLHHPEQVREKLDHMEYIVQQAKELTKKLMTFAKGETPTKQVVSIKELLVDSARLILYGSDVQYRFSFTEYLPGVEIDKDQIIQVFYNIMLNAVQAMQEGGTIWVSAENVLVSENDNSCLPLSPGQYVKVSIYDEGPGMLESHKQSVFDPFFTTKVEGSGLGLATAYSIIKNHHGYLQILSEMGQGSEVNVYLPALVTYHEISQMHCPPTVNDKNNGEVD